MSCLDGICQVKGLSGEVLRNGLSGEVTLKVNQIQRICSGGSEGEGQRSELWFTHNLVMKIMATWCWHSSVNQPSALIFYFLLYLYRSDSWWVTIMGYYIQKFLQKWLGLHTVVLRTQLCLILWAWVAELFYYFIHDSVSYYKLKCGISDDFWNSK